MADWPAISAPDWGTDGECFKPQIRTPFEGNYVQSRPAVTRAVGKWTLRWPLLPEAEYQTLETFFKAQQGNTFNWTEPVTGTVRVIRFTENSLKWKHAKKGYREVAVGIEEQ